MNVKRLQADLKLVHLTASPISVADISLQGFGKPFNSPQASAAAVYDLRTRHASVFGAKGHHQYGRRETLQAVRSYAQSEPRTPKAHEGPSA